MDNSEHSSQSTTKPISQNGINQRYSYLMVAVCVCLSMIAGAVSGWWYAKQNDFPEILVVDVKQIVGKKKKELIENYKQNPTNETIEAADKELQSFLQNLDQRLDKAGRGGNKLVLLKDVYLGGNARDITATLLNNE